MVTMPPSNWQDHYPISLACSEAAAATYRITIRHARRMTLGRKISLSLDRAYMNQHRTAHTLCFRKHFSDFFYVGAIHRA